MSVEPVHWPDARVKPWLQIIHFFISRVGIRQFFTSSGRFCRQMLVFGSSSYFVCSHCRHMADLLLRDS